MGSLLRGRATPAFRRAPLACLALLSSLLLGGCSLPSPQAGQYVPDPAAIQDTWDCTLASPDGGTRAGSPASDISGSVPNGFVPVSAVLCTWEPMLQDYPGATPGTPVPAAIREDRLGGDFADLLEALALPSDRGGNGPCTADMEILPHLWLVDGAGRAVNAQWPTDACGKSRGRPDTSKALDALPVVESTVLLVPRQAAGTETPKESGP